MLKFTINNLETNDSNINTEVVQELLSSLSDEPKDQFEDTWGGNDTYDLNVYIIDTDDGIDYYKGLVWSLTSVDGFMQLDQELAWFDLEIQE